MKIAGLQKLTLLDYPGKTACTVFTPGCDFRCPFCHNAELVVPTADGASNGGFPNVSEDELFTFLGKRHGLLDGVCVTGGEPTLQPGLAQFCARVKREGFAVKLDTNGTRPGALRSLLDAGLVDMVAMDVKNAPARYAETAGLAQDAFDIALIEESMLLLLGSGVPFEFRTTVVRELNDAASLRDLTCWIARLAEQAGADLARVPWFLQGFQDSAGVLAGEGVLSAWSADDLRGVLPGLQEILPLADLRGVE